MSDSFLESFAKNRAIGDFIKLKAGMSTGDNTIFQRKWFEVDNCNIDFSIKDNSETENSQIKWYPCNSGGEYRKWYGNHETIVNWKNNGQEIRNFGLESGKIRSAVRNDSFYFKRGLTWSKISSGKFAARCVPTGFLFDDTGRCGFSDDEQILLFTLGLFCSSLSNEFLKVLCPTLSFTSGEIAKIPFIQINYSLFGDLVKHLISISQQDWDFFETSWGFIRQPLLIRNMKVNSEQKEEQINIAYPLNTIIENAYSMLRIQWEMMITEMKKLEEENNRIFREAYGLQEEIDSEVPLEEITLTCNPHYRYNGDKSEEELEAQLLADTMKEFISYAVGCMFGRYALEAPGLIIASQGESIEDYYKKISKFHEEDNYQDMEIKCLFPADADNVIPILDGEWFTDDISERFFRFLRVTFGETNYQDNLIFIERAIGKDIRKYFLKDFYKDHVNRYKKRPIYWQFSSPNGSFNALIYMHRYQRDTVSVILNDYLREYLIKLTSRLEHLQMVNTSEEISKIEKTKNIKDIENLKKMIMELETWEREVIFPLATKQLEIDLDDGVKMNYNKFGKALKKIAGLSK